ncbi:UpxY family transcription antiterminator [Chitinophaga tropicalis]|uniref:UpxY family transcription antiterminator n=1 Tax=Chitinophaga tropicalis TaxID=2683588 RepID=A0A7K1UAK9_9BACT|nr:UpxY family transcription antiterminator [Chitinophaga tropicalis]MVT11412.1 UpxY family transcription antiterminator [Chitinophaga tropicalis]
MSQGQKESKKWYVLYTRPKFERKICKETDYLHIEHYLPLLTVNRRWSDRIKKIEEPLFSSYVFVKTNIRRGIDLLQIPGVIRFVASEGRPAEIQEGEIDRIRLIESQGNDLQREDYFTAGDEVIVTKGAFMGMKGILVGSLENGARLLIRLSLLKQAISVEMPVGDLMKIS